MSIEGRLKRIEKRLESEEGPSLRWPNPDGTFTEIHGCRSLADIAAICRASAVAKAGAGPTDEHRG
jgi:hypothetical protein